MTTITRRQFLYGSTAVGAGALAHRVGLAQQATAPAKVTSGADVVTLGKTGIQTSVLGLGTGTAAGREQREMGREGYVRLVREAYDRGVRYIDTADMYRMHPFIAAALKEVPRDKIFLQTKLSARKADAARNDIERLRKELEVETIDSLLIHCMTKAKWPADLRPMTDVLLDAKRKGWVRAIGVSCHSYEALCDAVDCEEMEVHLVRINPFSSHMDDKPEKVAEQLARMHKKNRGVIGMKIFGEGSFKTREKRLASLKYVLGLGTVQAFTIGFSSINQVDETLELIREATA